jgi:hypothetical protein
MTLEKTKVQLSLEREAGESPDGSPRRARLAARYRTDGTEPTAEELGDALRTLAELLERAVERAGLARGRAPRRERELAELIETYHPRQVELLDALRDEGELSDREYGSLQEYLTSQPAIGRFVPQEDREVPPASVEPRTPTRSSSADFGGERGTGAARGPAGGAPRPIPELLRTYRIDSLRQAGAVRARRQISYDEYMALKQHFSHPEDRAGGAGGSP